MAPPIPFSHKHHVGDNALDCRYCLTTVETSAFAGLPSTTICLTCHAQLFAQADVLAPLRRSAESGLPVARTVYTPPDLVYFNHGIHVAKGVTCIECHGRIDQMPMTWRTASLRMEWCLDRHRDPAPHLHPNGGGVLDARSSTDERRNGAVERSRIPRQALIASAWRTTKHSPERHSAAPRASLSRVIGKSRTCLPVAWKTALAIAAGAPVMPISRRRSKPGPACSSRTGRRHGGRTPPA